MTLSWETCYSLLAIHHDQTQKDECMGRGVSCMRSELLRGFFLKVIWQH